MSAKKSLESQVGDLFKGAPKLQEKTKKSLAQWLPWVVLLLGIFSLWLAYWLYLWADAITYTPNYLNDDLYRNYGSGRIESRWSVGVWFGFILLLVEGIIYLAAFTGVRDRKMKGWRLLFYALLINALYGLVMLFTPYVHFGTFIGYLIGSAVGLYFLFQIKSEYTK